MGHVFRADRLRPTPSLEGLDRPLLYLLGERDRGVPIAPMLTEAEALRTHGVDLSVETFPDGEHLLPGIDFWSTVSAWLTEQGLPQ